VPGDIIISKHAMDLKASLRLLRPHQWTKNLLCLVPLMLSQRWTEWPVVWKGGLGVLTFCVLSSLIYVVNDMMDVEADRRHPKKRLRPLASGAVTLTQGGFIILLLALLLAGLVLSQPWAAQRWILLYAVSAISYSVRLKRYLALDVVLVSLFYAIRLLYGGAVAGISVTIWTMVFALFVFLTLALVKRISEIQLMETAEDQSIGGRRPYRFQDRLVLMAQACASAYTSLLVVALYLNSPEVRTLYSRPQWLWMLLPALVYWLSRLLLIVHRGEMHHDPVVFALRDKVSWLVLIWTLIVLMSAR
jgi:4-hydroxybenzoate polyprenyltransferase